MSVLATIEPTELTVQPGADASLVVRVRNRGSIVDRFDITVVGPTAPWASVDQASLRLFPDKEGEARVTFRPPRAPDPNADTYPFGVSVRAASDDSASTVEEGRISVAPFVQLTTEIVPQTSRGSRSGSHEVTVHNIGNAVAEISVKGSDPDRLLDFNVVPARTGLRPDASATIRARVKPKQTFFLGAPKRIPFTVQVDEPTAGSHQVAATLEQRAIIPGWVKPVAGLVVAAIAALAVLPPILVGLGVLPSPSLTAQESTQPTQVVTAEPSLPPPTTVQQPSGEPTPSPALLGPPDSLTATGDGTGLNPDLTNISLECTGRRCRRDVVTPRVVQGLTGLQGVAIGAQLDSFTTTKPGTLVVLATWENPYPFLDAAGQELGRATEVAFDLAPLLVDGGKAYVRIQNAEGLVVSYFVPTENADLLLKSLYLVQPGSVPTPDPNASFDINLGGFYDRATLWGEALRDVRFVLP